MFCPLGKSRLLMHLKSNLSWKRPAFLFAHPSHQLSIGRSRYHRGFLTRWKYSSLSEKPLKLLEGRSPVAIRSKSLKHHAGLCSKVIEKSRLQDQVTFDYERLYASELDKIGERKSSQLCNVYGEDLFSDTFRKRRPNPVIVWSTNDYLGASRHPAVAEAIHRAVERHGCGASPGVAYGHNQLVVNLELSLAELHKKESSLLFSSGYAAKVATLCTLGRKIPNLVILSDKFNHPSMIEGIRNSKSAKLIFEHNSMTDLEAKLASIPVSQPKIIAFESVYSIYGSIAPIDRICDLAKQYGALTLVNEVHGVGIYGRRGGGITDHLDWSSPESTQLGVVPRVDIIVGSLAKAFGNIGGYVVGSAKFVNILRSFALEFKFTTTLPPHVIAGATAAVELLKCDSSQRIAHQHAVRKTKLLLRDLDIPVISGPSHIVPVHIGNAELANAITDKLLVEDGIYIQAINYPAVAVGGERLRITPTPLHTDESIERLGSLLTAIWKELKVPTLSECVKGSEGQDRDRWESIKQIWTDEQLMTKTSD